MDIPFKQATCYTSRFKGARLFGLLKPSEVILHVMQGTLAGTTAAFTNPNLGKDPKLGDPRSTHYGVGPAGITQFVKDEDSSWGASNWKHNLRGINIEVEAYADRDGSWLHAPQDSTYDNLIWLVATEAKRYGWNLDNVILRHSDCSHTPCPWHLDIERVRSGAKTALNPPPVIVPIVEAIIPPPTPTEPHSEFPKTVTVTVFELFVRSEPTTTAPLAGSMRLFKGNTFEAVERVSGESVNGNNQWYKSSLGHFCWTGGCN